MVNIRDAEILDILPYIFKSTKYIALSRAIAALTKWYYDTFTAVIFWGDIENAAECVLDELAAEVDAPFYSNDLPPDDKRAQIASAFRYNSSAGSALAVEQLLATAFVGEAALSEWFEYDGEPYHFRIDWLNPNGKVFGQGYALFMSRLNKVKPKRAKLDGINFKNELSPGSIYVGGMVAKRRVQRFGTIPAAKMKTYDDIRKIYGNFDELRKRTYDELLLYD